MNEPRSPSRQAGCFDLYRMFLAYLVTYLLLQKHLEGQGLPVPVRYGLAVAFGIGMFGVLQSLSHGMRKLFVARSGDDLATSPAGGRLLVFDLLISTALSVAIYAIGAMVR